MGMQQSPVLVRVHYLYKQCFQPLRVEPKHQGSPFLSELTSWTELPQHLHVLVHLVIASRCSAEECLVEENDKNNLLNAFNFVLKSNKLMLKVYKTTETRSFMNGCKNVLRGFSFLSSFFGLKLFGYCNMIFFFMTLSILMTNKVNFNVVKCGETLSKAR